MNEFIAYGDHNANKYRAGNILSFVEGLANCSCVRGFRAAKVIAIETFIDKRPLMIDLSSILSRLQPPWSLSHPESQAAWQQRWKLTRVCARTWR